MSVVGNDAARCVALAEDVQTISVPREIGQGAVVIQGIHPHRGIVIEVLRGVVLVPDRGDQVAMVVLEVLGSVGGVNLNTVPT